MEETIDLREYIRIIRKRYLIILMLPIIAVLTSALLSWFVIQPTYEANTTLIVGKVQGQTEGLGSNDYNMVMANKQLAKTYGEIAKSNTVLSKVNQELQLGYTAEELKKKVKVDSVGDTELISIAVQDRNPQEACRIANSLAGNFSSRVMEIKKVQYVSMVDKAAVPEKPIKPKKMLNVAVSGFLGLMIGSGLALLLEYLDNTLKSTEDVQRWLELPVLGVIPSFNTEKSQALEGSEPSAVGKKINNSRSIAITNSGSIPRTTD